MKGIFKMQMTSLTHKTIILLDYHFSKRKKGKAVNNQLTEIVKNRSLLCQKALDALRNSRSSSLVHCSHLISLNQEPHRCSLAWHF